MYQLYSLLLYKIFTSWLGPNYWCFALYRPIIEHRVVLELDVVPCPANCQSVILGSNTITSVSLVQGIITITSVSHGIMTIMTWWHRWTITTWLACGTHQWHIPLWRDPFWGHMDDWSRSGWRKTVPYVQSTCCFHTCQCGGPLYWCPISPWTGEYL